MSTPQGKDSWDKIQVLGAAAIPFVIALLGWFFSSSLQSREVDAEYVQLAIEVLQNQDTADVSFQLRLWAVDVLDELGPISMPPGLRDAISSGTVSFPRSEEPRGLVRLEIGMESDMIVTLDGARESGPGISGWVTRVSPGFHEVVWLKSDRSNLCSYRGEFREGEDTRLLCDRETGVVSVDTGQPPDI